MKYHYLIDYENVHEEGLTGLNTIEDDAVIHIFYSDRARKLDLDSFREGQILQIEALKVPVGKQSLDMQLVSYMGYLMGREKGEGNKYIIISKDNGYLNSIPFWRQIMKDGTTVEVRPQIRPKDTEETKGTGSAAASESKRLSVLKPSSDLKTPRSPRPEKNERPERRLRGRGRRGRREELPSSAEASAAADSPAETPAPEAGDLIRETEAAAPAVQKESAFAETLIQPEETADAVKEAKEAASEEPAAAETAADSPEEAKEAAAEDTAARESTADAAKEAKEAAAENTAAAETAAGSSEETKEASVENAAVSEIDADSPEETKEASAKEPAADPAMAVNETAAEIPAEPAAGSVKETKETASEEPAGTAKEAPEKEAAPAKQKRPRSQGKTRVQKKSLDRSQLNTNVMQTLSKSNVDAATTGKISSIVMKHASEEQNKTKIYREIIGTLGQKEGLKIYNYIKSLL